MSLNITVATSSESARVDRQPARLGFVGLGAMGSRITRRLLDTGHTVTGYDLLAAKAQELAAMDGTYIGENGLALSLKLATNISTAVQMLALELGRELQVSLPTGSVVNEFLSSARAHGWGEKDFAVLYQVLAQMSGVTA